MIVNVIISEEERYMKRLTALFLAVIMLCTLLPVAAVAADAAGKLVIVTDTGAKEVSMTADISGEGWTWSAKKSWTDENGGTHLGVLTLSGFVGQSIYADGDLKLVLKGKNIITLPNKGEYGIKVSGKLLVDKSSSTANDTLTITQATTASQSNLILTGGMGETKNCVINGGTVTLSNTTGGGKGNGIGFNVSVNNDANLSVSVPYRGVAATLTANTTGTVNITTTGKDPTACAVSALNAKGSGSVTLKAVTPAVAVSDALTIASTAGNVTVNGFVKVSSDPLTKFNIAPNKRLKDTDSYYQGYYTSDTASTKGYFLTDSQGNPLYSSCYVSADSATLTVMDSPLYDLNELVVNRKIDTKGVGIKNGTRGGAGDYVYSLKFGSTLPKGLNLNEKTGEISGTPTSACDAGRAVIVVKDKNGVSGCSQTEVTIEYSSVKAADAYMEIGNSGPIDMTRDAVDITGRWSYTGISRTLTLDGYDGGVIKADSDLNIVLKGTNTITLPGTAQEGISVNGKLTIDCYSSSAVDKLTVKQVTTSTSANLIVTGGTGEAKACEINGGTVTLTCSSGSDMGMGVKNSVYVNNDANLTVTASYRGVGRELYADTTGLVSINSLGKSVGSAAVNKLNAKGSGTVSLVAGDGASTVISAISIDKDAGNVMLTGYTKVNEEPYANFSIAPNKQAYMNSQAIENYYFGYNVTGMAGTGYYLTDGIGNPLPSAIFQTNESQRLSVMDSVLFYLPEMIIGIPYRNELYLSCATRGGEGDYCYSLREDSSLPKGLVLNSATGQISGTPSAVCDAGTAVIVVEDKNGAEGCSSCEVMIHYGAVEDCVLIAPSISGSNVETSGKVRITWPVVPGAEKYEVFRATSRNGSFSKYYTTSGTSYTNTSAVAGKTYYYKVRAIGYDGTEGDFSRVIDRTCDCARPVVTISNVDSTGKLKLTWNAVDGANKYEIYRATSLGGTFAKYYTTTSTSFSNTSVVAGSTYYYQVRAISNLSSYATSAFSEIMSGTGHCASPTVKTSNDAKTGKIILTWNSIEGASKYIVYRAGTKDGTYSKLYTTVYTSMTNTGANAGYTYYYKVVAVCADTEEGNSAASTVVSRTCDCGRPDVSIALSSSGKPRLTWKAVDGADKYIIYRANTKNGTYTKMYTTVYTSYTNTGASKGKAYFYKVVAISNRSSYADSAYSGIVSITSK